MNNRKLITSMIGAFALLSLLTSQASAGTCSTEIRKFPTTALVFENIRLRCMINDIPPITVGIVEARNQNGTKTLTATLAGVGQDPRIEMRVIGINAQGIPLGNCLIRATTPGVPVTVNCPSAERYRGNLHYLE